MTHHRSACCRATVEHFREGYSCKHCFELCALLEPDASVFSLYSEREALEDVPATGADDATDPGIPQVGE